jgi:pilus assembly protein Flp/PilA
MSAVVHYPVSLYRKVRKFLTGKKEEEGASLVEYALLVGLIAVACMVAIEALSGGISTLFNNIATKLKGLSVS